MKRISEIAKVLRIRRSELGISGKEMAKELGISIAFLSSMETGRSNFPDRILYSLLNSTWFETEEKQKELILACVKQIEFLSDIRDPKILNTIAKSYINYLERLYQTGDEK